MGDGPCPERRVALERTARSLVASCEHGAGLERPGVGGAVQASCPHLRCPLSSPGDPGTQAEPRGLRGTPETSHRREVWVTEAAGAWHLRSPQAKPWLSWGRSRSQPGPGPAGVRTEAPSQGILV